MANDRLVDPDPAATATEVRLVQSFSDAQYLRGSRRQRLSAGLDSDVIDADTAANEEKPAVHPTTSFDLRPMVAGFANKTELMGLCHSRLHHGGRVAAGTHVARSMRDRNALPLRHIVVFLQLC